MPNKLDATGTTSFPAALDTLGKFLQMTDSPLAFSTLSNSIDGAVQTIPVDDLGVFDDGPSIVTIEGTEEIIWYTDKQAESGAGNLQSCKRNWGNNARRFAVTDADNAANWLEIDGDQTSLIAVNDKVTVYDDGANNGEFTVSSRSFVGGSTRIFTSESVTTNGAGGTLMLGALGTGQSAAAGTRVWHLMGAEQIRIISEALIAAQTKIGETGSTDPGSLEYRITQLESFTLGDIFALGILGASVNAGVGDGDVVYWNGGATEFDVADAAGGDTPVGTAEEVTNNYTIIASDGGSEYFEIAGDHRSEFQPGASFDVSGSSGGSDDGTYTVISSALNGSDTRITVADVPTGTGDGTITVTSWKITLVGLAEGYSGLTPGTVYYLDPTTPGALTTSVNAWQIGVAYTSTQLIVNLIYAQNYPRILLNQTVHSAVAERDVVYFDGASGSYKQAKATGGAYPPIGIAINVSSLTADIVLEGQVTGFTGLSSGSIYYLSASTEGAITRPQPTTDHEGYLIGRADSSTILRVSIMRNQHSINVPVDATGWTKLAGSPTTLQAALEAAEAALTGIDYSEVSSNDGATDVTGAELEQLTDGSEVSGLHVHDSLYNGGLWDKNEIQLILDEDASGADYIVPVGISVAPVVSWNGDFWEYAEAGLYRMLVGAGISAQAYLHTDSTRLIRPAWEPEIIFRIRPDAFITDSTGIFWIGAFSGDPMASATPALHYAAFRYDQALDSGTGNWVAASDSGGGSPQTTDTGIAYADGTDYTFMIKLDVPAGARARFYINGVLVATHISKPPGLTTDLNAWVACRTDDQFDSKSLWFGRLAIRRLS